MSRYCLFRGARCRGPACFGAQDVAVLPVSGRKMSRYCLFRGARCRGTACFGAQDVAVLLVSGRKMSRYCLLWGARCRCTSCFGAQDAVALPVSGACSGGVVGHTMPRYCLFQGHVQLVWWGARCRGTACFRGMFSWCGGAQDAAVLPVWGHCEHGKPDGVVRQAYERTS